MGFTSSSQNVLVILTFLQETKKAGVPPGTVLVFSCFLFLYNSQRVGHGDGRHRVISRDLEPYMYYALSLPQIKYLALYKF